MNAYELADDLWDKDTQASQQSLQDWAEQSANMLRQKADRIAELESEVSNLKHMNKNWQLSETMAYNRIAELEKQLDIRTRELIGASFYEHDYKTLMANSEPVACKHGVDDGACKECYQEATQTKPLNDAIAIIKDFQSDDVPPCKYYEDNYADGWMDACNEILWAIEAKLLGKD